MPHIHTAPGQMDHTVTAYIVRTDGVGPKVLLHMHRKHHKLLPVGGHIELDETPWSAIIREVAEEAGYTQAELNVMQPPVRIAMLDDVVVHPQPVFCNTHAISPSHFHCDAAYLFQTSASPSSGVTDGESDDLRWLSRSEIENASHQVIPANVQAVCLSILDSIYGNWEPLQASSFSIRSNP